MRNWIGLATVGFASAGFAAAPQPPAPLFASDGPINVRIQGPMNSLVSNRKEVARPGTMVVDGVTYPIALTPRGITRRTSDTCDFPPLRVELTQAAPPGSLFAHQRKLKLVTHCKRDTSFQQKVLLEYSAYRLYNLMTPLSFRARLANIDYVDESGRPYVSRIGFFLEDFSDVAMPLRLATAHMPALISVSQIEPESGARFAVFEYMISNYDWSMRAGPQGTECCHNGRLLSGAARGLLTPVPYDFDFSGLVDAPYAGPPEGIPIENLKQRNYRGYCMHLTQARALGAQLLPRRAEFLGVFATVPGLDQSNQARASAFIDGFFKDLASGRIFKSCVS
jgi:hypothetical protein